MSDDKQVNQPQNDVQEAEVKQTQTDEKPTASFNQDMLIEQSNKDQKLKKQNIKECQMKLRKRKKKS